MVPKVKRSYKTKTNNVIKNSGRYYEVTKKSMGKGLEYGTPSEKQPLLVNKSKTSAGRVTVIKVLKDLGV